MTTFTWNADQGRGEFQTDRLTGVLRADGRQVLISEVIDRLSGRRIDGGMLFAPYRLLARSAWMGEAREMTHRVTPQANGIDVEWEPSIAHQVSLRMEIRIGRVGILDCAIEVVGHAYYPAYEVFLSSYFARGFAPGGYLAPLAPSELDATQVRPQANPIFREMYVAFPRDEAAAGLLTDGRWRRGRHHTRFLAARYYGMPLGFYARDDGPLDVLLMGLPEDVYSVSMAYRTDDPSDDVGQHNSLYLSLFGRDLHPGERWRTSVRLVIDDFNRDRERHRTAFDAFRDSVSRGSLALP